MPKKVLALSVRDYSGCRQTVMNDPGAQQSSQMFFTWVKARPHHWELRALLLIDSGRVPPKRINGFRYLNFVYQSLIEKCCVARC